MNTTGHNVGDARLRAFIDRVLRLKAEQDELTADIREVYAEAKAVGYDKTGMGALVAHLRKVEKSGLDAVEERDAVFSLYLEAYERASHAHAPARAHGNIEEFPPHDAQTGALADEIGTPLDEASRTTPAGSVADAIPAPIPAPVDQRTDRDTPTVEAAGSNPAGRTTDEPFEPPAFLRKDADWPELPAILDRRGRP